VGVCTHILHFFHRLHQIPIQQAWHWLKNEGCVCTKTP
jgi:hypothetical protein